MVSTGGQPKGLIRLTDDDMLKLFSFFAFNLELIPPLMCITKILP